jgi:hypothetical protein
MSANGTELPIPNVCSSVANGSKADKIWSMGVLHILTHFGPQASDCALMHNTAQTAMMRSVEPGQNNETALRRQSR